MFVIETKGLFWRRPARGWLNWTQHVNEAHAFIDANAAHQIVDALHDKGITSACVIALNTLTHKL